MLAVNLVPRFLTPISPQPDLPLFVYLPGMDGTGVLLRSQIEKGLGSEFNIRCLTIPQDDLSRWDALASKVAELLEAEIAKGARRPVYVCGESFGGCLALKVALLAPQLIDKLILVNPASCFNGRFWMQWGSHLTGWLPPNFYPVSVVGFLPFLASLRRMAPRDRQDLLAAMQSVPQPTSTWRVALIREFEIYATQLSLITQQVLVIVGTDDLVLPSVAESERLTKFMPNAKRVVLRDSGHACLLESDVNLYAILKEQKFLPSREAVLAAVRTPPG